MPPSRRTRILLATAVTFAVAAGCTSAPDGEPIPGVRSEARLLDPAAREPAPTSVVPVLGAPDEQRSLVEHRGDVVVLNFWASWCGPCRREQPDLNEAAEALAGQDVVFLGVNIQDSIANAQAHEREFAIPYPSLFDPSNAFAAGFRGVGPRSIPSTIVLDRDGQVAVRLFGILADADELVAAVEAILAEGEEAPSPS